MLAMPPQMNTCELCQVPGCSNSLYIQLHSCVPMSPTVSPPFPLCSCPGVQHAAQTTHLQQSLADLERGNQRALVNWSCSSQICSCLQLSYRLSILYCTPIGGQRSFCGLGIRACLSNEYHQDAFFELAREIREAQFYRQVASRLNQREKVRLNTVQSPKLLGR